jgi:hypothetical protein
MIPGSFVATSQNSKKKKTLLFSDQILRVLMGLLDQLAAGFVYIFNLSLRGIEPVVVVVSLIA